MRKTTILFALLISLSGGAFPQAKQDKSLNDKTLVAWVIPDKVEQKGGSVLTVDDGFGHFDGIVLGERKKQGWMAGSDSYRRSGKEENSCLDEPGQLTEWRQVAIVYEGSIITLYINGRNCASYKVDNKQTFNRSSSIVFGKRHIEMQGDGYFQGKIAEARIYDFAMDPKVIWKLKPDTLSGPEPWAWWTFTDGSLLDQTGHFSQIRITGDVKTKDGCLILGGNQATVIASAGETGKKTASARILSDELPVPKRVIQSTREFRERLLADPYRPVYHFCVPEDNGMPGDPNGAFFYQGRYHLMYLYNREGSGFSWGHLSSTDLVHWRNHPDALIPGNGDEGVFSGGAFVTPEGKAYLTYWELWGAKGIGIAESVDRNFDIFQKIPENPVIKSTEWGITEIEKEDRGTNEEIETRDARRETRKTVYGSADPSNIWMNNGKYYMLTGNLLVLNKYGRQPDSPADMQGDRTYLFVSEDLKKWEYLHPFYESKREWTDQSEDNMCPSFLPLANGPDGGSFSSKHLMLFISHNKGCQYYTGTYKKDRFYPEKHGRMTWVDNGYFAPEALVDDKGRQVMWAWIFDDRPDSLKNHTGWTGSYGLPRSLWLGKDGELCMRPVEELKMLRLNEKSQNNLTVKNGQEVNLDKLGTELMELEITIDPGTATRIGAKVGYSTDGQEYTVLSYDKSEQKLKFDATKSSLTMGRRNIESAPFELKKGEPLVWRIFVDRSIIEIYSNDRQAIARAAYPTLGGTGLRLFAEGGDIKVISIKAWEMMPSNAY